VNGGTTFQFEWDAAKEASNQRKHAVSFDSAATIFDDPFLITAPDEKHNFNEERFRSIGHAINGAVLYVVHTISEAGLIANVRIISARKATKREIYAFKEQISQ
jgi:uncharacterized protein